MPHQENPDLDAVVTAVGALLDDMVARRGRDHAVARLKLTIVMYVRLAYSIGSKSAIETFIRGVVTGPVSDNGKPIKSKPPGAS